MAPTSFAERWRIAWASRRFRAQSLLSLAVLATIAFLIPRFFIYIQQREGIVLNDPLLRVLPPVDFSPYTFTLIYGALIISIVILSFAPQRLLLFVQSYCITTMLRVITLFLFPLNDPQGLIVLRDPFVNIFGYGGNVITKDLFFSGHVSTIVLLSLSVPQKTMKVILICLAVVVASLILLQHVHYTIDVVAAPIFSWIAWRISQQFSRAMS